MSWAQEEALDVEWAHAIAPGASIVLVETNSFSIPDLMAGVKTAAAQPGVSVVSMSWGGSESPVCDLLRPPIHDRRNHLRGRQRRRRPLRRSPVARFVAHVVGVGGTTLQVSSSGTYQGETAWVGSSGGDSTIETEPGFQ